VDREGTSNSHRGSGRQDAALYGSQDGRRYGRECHAKHALAHPRQLRNCARSCCRSRPFLECGGKRCTTPEPGVNTAARRKSKAPSPLRSRLWLRRGKLHLTWPRRSAAKTGAGALQRLAPVQSVRGKENASGGKRGAKHIPGDSPDGTGATVRAIGHGLFVTLFPAVRVGGSPTGAGGSPAPPIFKTGSQTECVRLSSSNRCRVACSRRMTTSAIRVISS
jgi:hypothetical protein